jgi:hypothetical protein
MSSFFSHVHILILLFCAGLTGIRDSSFGYALANGTVGAYHKQKRAWANKSKNTVTSLSCTIVFVDCEVQFAFV